jgi:hypothetical protein
MRVDEQPRLIEDVLNEYNFYDNLDGNLYLPASQRMWAWKDKRGMKKMIKLIDSVMSGFPIPSCILHRVSNRRYEVYDGRHRIETMWKYKNNEFKWDDKFYKDLSTTEKDLFNRRRIPLTIVSGATPSQLADAFIRLNSGSPLKDSDMFWAMKDCPLLKAVERLVLSNARLSVALGGQDLKHRPDLGNWVGLVYGLTTRNSGNMTTSYIRLSNDSDGGLDIDVDDAFVKQGIDAVCSVLESAWLQLDGAGRLNGTGSVSPAEKKKFKKLGKILMLLLDEWMRADNKLATITKWRDIVVRYRGEKKLQRAMYNYSGGHPNKNKIENILARLNTYLETGRLDDDSSYDSEDEDP